MSIVAEDPPLGNSMWLKTLELEFREGGNGTVKKTWKMSPSFVVQQSQDCRTCITYLSLLLHRTPCPQWLLISHSLNLWLILALVGLRQPFQHSTSQLLSFLLIPNSSTFNSERRHLPDTWGHGEYRKENQLQFLGKSKQVKTISKSLKQMSPRFME